MRHFLILLLGLLLVSVSTLSQTAPSDSQTLQALLAEVRQLRQDLQTTAISAQKAQILIYRLQVQESAVSRMQARVDDTRSKLSQVRSEQKDLAATIKRLEDRRSRTETPPTEQKDLEDTLAQIKARYEASVNSEQEMQAEVAEAQDQLRMEQAKLGELEDHLERLEKALSSNPH